MTNRLSLRGGAEGDAQSARAGETSKPSDNSAADLTVFELADVLIRRRALIAGATLAVMILTAIIVWFIPNQYCSKASILPSGQVDRMAELRNLAGLGSPTTTDENSSQLFPAIFQSRTVTEAVLGANYSFQHDGRTGAIKLGDYFGTDDPDALFGKLASVTTVVVDKKSGLIVLSVETEYPGLSQAIATEYMAQLESYNMHQRRSQARERQTYLSREMAHQKQELEAAEDSLAGFQQYNRNWAATTDPTLIKLVARMQRDVEVKGKTYAYLTQEYEVAKLDVQKDLPIVRILDKPSLPTEKSGPQRKLAVFLACVAAFIGMSLLVLAAAILRRDADGRGLAHYAALREDAARAFPRIKKLAARLRVRETVGA